MTDDNESLEENKHLFTHKAVAPFKNIRDFSHSVQRSMLGGKLWNQKLNRERSFAHRNLAGLQKTFETKLTSIVKQLESDDINMTKARKLSRELFRDSYKQAFTLGMRASGAGIAQGYSLGGFESASPKLYAVDTDWIKTAADSELKFWMSFLSQVDDGFEGRHYTKEQRVGMYVDAIEAQFDSGRVAGSPAYSFFEWIMDGHQENCPSCEYLAGNSPWPRELIVTVPKASLTPCRMNCGCYLKIQVVTNMVYLNRKRVLPPASTVYRKLQAVFRAPRNWRYDKARRDLVRADSPVGFKTVIPRSSRLLKR